MWVLCKKNLIFFQNWRFFNIFKQIYFQVQSFLCRNFFSFWMQKNKENFISIRNMFLMSRNNGETMVLSSIITNHNFWTSCHRTKIKGYSDRKVYTFSWYAFIFVHMIQKLCVEKKWVYFRFIYRCYFWLLTLNAI